MVTQLNLKGVNNMNKTCSLTVMSATGKKLYGTAAQLRNTSLNGGYDKFISSLKHKSEPLFTIIETTPLFTFIQ